MVHPVTTCGLGGLAGIKYCVVCCLYLQPVRGVKAVAVLLVDLLDASGTLMSKVRQCTVGITVCTSFPVRPTTTTTTLTRLLGWLTGSWHCILLHNLHHVCLSPRHHPSGGPSACSAAAVMKQHSCYMAYMSLAQVRDLVGNNPIILVGTKMDLLPAGCHPKAVAEWLAESAIRKRLQVASCHLVSSHTGEGIAAVTAKICRERKGRDVFVVGAANVGKSAFIRAMLKEMSRSVCFWARAFPS